MPESKKDPGWETTALKEANPQSGVQALATKEQSFPPVQSIGLFVFVFFPQNNTET